MKAIFFILPLMLSWTVLANSDAVVVDSEADGPTVTYMGHISPTCSVSPQNVFYLNATNEILSYAAGSADPLCPKFRNDDHIKQGYRELFAQRLSALGSCIDPEYPRWRMDSTTHELGLTDIPFLPVNCSPEGQWVVMDERAFGNMLNGYYSKDESRFDEIFSMFPIYRRDSTPYYLRDYSSEQRNYINTMIRDMSFSRPIKID